MASYPSSQSHGGLGNYSGNQEKSAQIQIGLSSYGQSLSSEQLDLNNLGSLPSYQQQYSSQQYGGQSPPAPYGNQCSNGNWSNQIDLNDPQLLQQVDQIVSSLIENKRPVLRRQVITVPATTPGRVACITRRLPTPPPDIVERITVVKPPRDVINLCIEKPVQPGPCYQERNICGKPRKPVIQPRVVQVPPRSGAPASGNCPPCPPCPPQAQIQIFAAQGSAASGSIQQATSSLPQQQQQAPTQTLGQAIAQQPWIPVPPLQTAAFQQQQPPVYQQPTQTYANQTQYQQAPPPQYAPQPSIAPQQYPPQYAPQPGAYPPQPQQPIYQTPDALQQSQTGLAQSQTGFAPQQGYPQNYGAPQAQPQYGQYQPQQAPQGY